MKILILGGNRNFGKIVLEDLLKKNHTIYLVNRNTKKKNITHKNLKHICCDRKELKKYLHFFKNINFDFIFDNIAYKLNDVKKLHILLKNKFNHYIFTSSIITYLNSNNKVEVKEKDWSKGKISNEWIREKNYKKIDLNYARNKRNIEKYLISNKKINFTIMRVPNVIGKDDFSKKTQRLLAYPFFKKKNKIKGSDYLQFIYKPDLVKIIVKIIHKKQNARQIFNVANKKIKVEDFFQKIKNHKNFPKKKYKKYVNFDFPMPTNSLLNCDLVTKKFSFKFTSVNKIIKTIY